MSAVGGTGSSRSHAALAVGVLALMASMIVAYGVSAPAPVASANTVAAVETAPAPAPAVTDAPEPETSEPVASRAPPTVAVVGDSLAYSVAGELDASLRLLGVTPVLQVAPGRHVQDWGLDGLISPGLVVVDELRSVGPALWVIQLGTNDIADGPLDSGLYASWITAMLDEIGPNTPVVWMGVHRLDLPAESQAFDAVLRLLDTERRELSVADWAQVALSEPVLADDGVHLTEAGGHRFVETIAAAVQARLAASG
ncbi:MAG TPA: hypothetical protein VFP08_07680 [Acidimicrobiales bacterium]|nr:hypothetical protein [Acidimicrobiales bacterium]